jgi:hypothetical protein
MIGDIPEDLAGSVPNAAADPHLAAALAEAASWVGTNGVEAVGQGVTEAGTPCILVYVGRGETQVPGEVAGVTVRVERTGPFQALDDLTAAPPPDDEPTS